MLDKKSIYCHIDVSKKEDTIISVLSHRGDLVMLNIQKNVFIVTLM